MLGAGVSAGVLAAAFRRGIVSFPKLPQPEPGEVLLVCTCYEEDTALWGGLR